MFFKNVLMVMPQFWFGIFNGFSGQSFYEQWQYQVYNLFFTSLPIVWFSIFDLQFPRKELLASPKLHYKDVGQLNLLFDRSTFWRYVIQAILQALFMVFMVAYCLEYRYINPLGHTPSFWVLGTIVYCYVVIQVNFEVAYQSSSHTVMSLLIQSLSALLFFLFYYGQNLIDWIPVLNGTFFYIWLTPPFFLCLFALLATQLLCHVLYNGAKDTIQRIVKKIRQGSLKAQIR